MKIVKEKSESMIKWLILLLACIMMIGNYYCYDIPAALHSQMDEYFGKPSDFETLFSLLYTLYAIPNIILPFFGGYFTDKWGARICLIIFSCFITAGQAIFALGLSVKSWPIMFIGRIVFGIGGESMGVANSAILSVWFKGKELAFAFGLNLSISRLGSVANNLVSPVIADSVGIVFALWFGVVLCGSSVACALLISYFDRKLEREILENKGVFTVLNNEDDDVDEDITTKETRQSLKRSLLNKNDDDIDTILLNPSEDTSNKRSLSKDQIATATTRDNSNSVVTNEENKKVEPKFKDIFTFPHIFWIICIICVVVYGCVLPFNNIASTLLLERNYFKEPPNDCQLANPNECQSDTNKPIGCPSSTWYQPPLPEHAVVSGDTYDPVTSDDIDCTDDAWKDDCTEQYCSRQTSAQIEAATIMSIPYIISACLSPILGGFVDKFGKRAIIATIAPAILVIVHATLGYTDCSPVGPLIGQGFAYSGFAAVIWPSIPLVIPENLVGFAYGVAFSIQNAGLAAFPLIIASIYSSNGDKYIPQVELFFTLLAAVGVLVGIYMNYYDYYYINSKLNDPDYISTPIENNDDLILTNPLHNNDDNNDDNKDLSHSNSQLFSNVTSDNDEVSGTNVLRNSFSK